MIDEPEAQLVRRAQEGDAEAFGELVVPWRPTALRVATVVLGGAPGAEDVVQDATVRAWRSVGSVDPELGFRAWFLRAVANTARNDRRSQGRRAALVVRVAAEPAGSALGPEERAVSNQEREVVVTALNRLSSDDRLVIALRYFEQLSESELAQVLDCPNGTVKSRLSRAMARLRAELNLQAELEVRHA